MVVSRVAHHAAPARQPREGLERPFVRREERLLHQDVLAVLEQLGQELRLGGIGHADQRSVVRLRSHVLECAEIGVCDARIHRRDHVGAGHLPALPALDPEPDDDHAHGA